MDMPNTFSGKGQFPYQRPRRLRQNERIRRLVEETRLSPDPWVMPYFILEGLGRLGPVRDDLGNARPTTLEFATEMLRSDIGTRKQETPPLNLPGRLKLFDKSACGVSRGH